MRRRTSTDSTSRRSISKRTSPSTTRQKHKRKSYPICSAAESNTGRASDKRLLKKAILPGLCAARQFREAGIRKERIWQLLAILIHYAERGRAAHVRNRSGIGPKRKSKLTRLAANLKQPFILLVAQAPKIRRTQIRAVQRPTNGAGDYPRDPDLPNAAQSDEIEAACLSVV
jgi:hypothetical protein